MKEIPGYEGRYTIDISGKVFSLVTNKPMVDRPKATDSRYRIIDLRKGNKWIDGVLQKRYRKTWSVHRLVLMTYAPVEGMDELHVNHKDGDPTNNHLSNLEWCTPSENNTHSFRILKNKNPRYDPDKRKLIHELREKGWTYKQITEKYGFPKSTISYYTNSKLETQYNQH